MADPGFPVGGGVDLIGGGVDSQGSYVSKILYVKTKELGPLGGAHAGRTPLDLPMCWREIYWTLTSVTCTDIPPCDIITMGIDSL